jgi:hypothetical protein
LISLPAVCCAAGSAEQAGFSSAEILPLETGTWRFYRLTP